jgi:hypothetical protein
MGLFFWVIEMFIFVNSFWCGFCGSCNLSSDLVDRMLYASLEIKGFVHIILEIKTQLIFYTLLILLDVGFLVW